MRRVRSKAGSHQRTISSKPIPILVTRILSENMRNTYSDTNRVARSVYNGSYTHSITQKAATSATENTQVVPTVRQMPETIHNVIVFPNGKVIAEETVPFIDVMLGERAARKKRGSAV